VRRVLEAHLRVPNLCWPSVDPDMAANPETLAGVAGRFALARHDDERVRLARDKLGLNKLFFAVDRQGVLAANYLADLADAGVPFEAICSAPAGAAVEIDLVRKAVTTRRHHRLPRAAGQSSEPASALDTIAEAVARAMTVSSQRRSASRWAMA
jgi:asparagine synthetase B (glutamine-hydrolysing)